MSPTGLVSVSRPMLGCGSNGSYRCWYINWRHNWQRAYAIIGRRNRQEAAEKIRAAERAALYEEDHGVPDGYGIDTINGGFFKLDDDSCREELVQVQAENSLLWHEVTKLREELEALRPGAEPAEVTKQRSADGKFVSAGA